MSFSVSLNCPDPDFNGAPLFNVKYFRNGRRQTQLQCNTDSYLHTPCSRV